MSKLNELISQFCPDGVEYKRLNEISEMKRGTSVTKKGITEGDIPVISGGREPAYYCDTFNRDGETITVAGSGAGAGYVQYWTIPIFVCDAFSIKGHECIQTKYLYHYLANMQEYIYSTKKGGGVPHVHISSIENVKIPIPPLPVQCEIVRILDNFTELTTELTTELATELTARKQQYEYYSNALFDGNNATQMVCVTDLCDDIFLGLTSKVDYVDEGGVPLVRANNMSTGVLLLNDVRYISEKQHQKLTKNHKAKKGDILVSKSGTLGIVCVVDVDIEFSIYESLICLQPNNQIYNRYLLHLLRSSKVQESMLEKKVGNAIKHLNLMTFRNLLVPVPPLEKQKYIADVLDKLDTNYAEISEKLSTEIELRQKQYEFYRDKLLSFKEIDTNGETNNSGSD